MSTVLLNMHMCEFLQGTDKGGHSSMEGEEQSTVAGILCIAWIQLY